MTVKRTVLSVIALLMVSGIPVAAQQSLGELVAQGGYDWFIGRWVATTDDGDSLVFEQKWALDRHAIWVDFQMRDFKMSGLIVFVPSREEVLQFGADNQGGTWKGTWRDEYGSAVHGIEHTRPDGEIHKAEIVHTKVDADTMKVVMYGLDGNGDRNAEPWSTLTYKRQASAPASPGSAGRDSTGSAVGALGDLLHRNGYDWLMGQWHAIDEQGRTSQVKYGLTLNRHAGFVVVKIGRFAYRGLVMFVPSREEVIQIGADNMGGFWQGSWREDYEGVVNAHEYIRADGTIDKMEHVYVKVDGGSFKVKQYAVEAGGYRASTPRGELTFRRQKIEAVEK